MKFLELKLDNSKLMVIKFAPRTSDPALHDHGNDYQVSIPLVGNSFVEHNNRTRPIGDSRLVTAPGEQHRHYANGDGGRVLLVNVNRDFVRQILSDTLGDAPQDLAFQSWGEGPSDGFRRLADHIMRLTMTGSLEGTELQQVEMELAQLLLSLQDGSHSAAWRKRVLLSHHPQLQRAVDYIHDNFTEDLSLDTLASEAGLSKYHFIRLFRQQLGSTPAAYVTRVRVETVATRLAQTNDDVTRMAFDVGFGSVSAFERAFRTHFRVTPTEYRKQQRNAR